MLTLSSKPSLEILDNGEKSSISLTALLNIIDGAAAHEVSLLGRIARSTSTNNHIGSGLDHDDELPRETGRCSDPPGPRGPPNQVHAGHT
jgi:hypothetical protein